MVTNSNLKILMQKLFDDEQTLEKIEETDDLEKLYQICLTIQDGYTLEEFVNFFEDLVYICREEANEIEKMEENELGDVSGGVSAFKRLTASALAAATSLTGGIGYYARAEEPSQEIVDDWDFSDWREADSEEQGTVDENVAEVPETVEENASEEQKIVEENVAEEQLVKEPVLEEEPYQYRSTDDEISDDQLSFWGKAKKWLSKSLDYIWDNKGKILLASAALLGVGGLVVYESDQISQNINKWREDRNKSKQFKEANKRKQSRLDGLNIEIDQNQGRIDELREELKDDLIDANKEGKLSSDEREKLEGELKGFEKNQDGLDESEKARQHKVNKLLELDDLHKKVSLEQSQYEHLSYQILHDNKREQSRQEGSSAKKLTEGLLVLGGVATAAEKGWELLKQGYYKLKGLGEVGQVVKNIFNDAQLFAIRYSDLNKKIDMWLQKNETKNFDYSDGAKRLDYLYDNLIHGQDKAKKTLKQFYQKFAYSLEKEKQGIATEKDLSAKILVLNGPSGTGKTYMAKLLSSCLTKIEPFYINAGKLLKDAGDYASAEGLQSAFWAGGKKLGMDVGKGQTSFNSLADYIKSTEGSVRVIIVDEYDKVYNSKPTNSYMNCTKHPFDEMFRMMLDTNSYEDPFYGYKLDLSKTIFICTTNETKASLRGDIKYVESAPPSLFSSKSAGVLKQLKRDENGQLEKDENGKPTGNVIDPELDPTGTQTLVPHDGSFVQRIAGNVCYFDSLRLEDYDRIARDALGDDPEIKNMEDLQSIGGTDKVILDYRINYKLGSVEIDDKGYKLIAEYASKMPSGARSIVGANGNDEGSVAGNLRSALHNYCSAQLAQKHSVKNIKLKAIPRLAKNSAELPIVEFNIIPLGYAE